MSYYRDEYHQAEDKSEDTSLHFSYLFMGDNILLVEEVVKQGTTDEKIFSVQEECFLSKL
jgi:hypothetical protein